MKYFIPLLSAILILLFSCGEKTSKTDEMEMENDAFVRLSKKQFEANNYSFDTLQLRPFHVYVEASGMIDVPPQNKAIISTTYAGYVKDTRLLEGDQVRKGQPLLTLEGPEFIKLQQEYMEVFNQLDYLQAEYKRQQTLFEERISSQKQYLKAKSDYETTLAMYEGLKAQLRLLSIPLKSVEKGNFSSTVTLYAPIAGHVSHIDMAKGAFVNPSETLMEIVDNEHVHLELQVYEKDIMKIKKGQKIQFTISEASDEVFMAEVHLAGTTLNETNRSIKVHGHLDDEESHGLLVGMFVNAKIICESIEKPSLREESVIEQGEENVALRLDHSTDTDYFFVREYPKTSEADNGFRALEVKMETTPKVYLGEGAFQLVGEGVGHDH